jgi:hypothetical protein
MHGFASCPRLRSKWIKWGRKDETCGVSEMFGRVVFSSVADHCHLRRSATGGLAGLWFGDCGGRGCVSP